MLSIYGSYSFMMIFLLCLFFFSVLIKMESSL